ncbi:MAG: hypothetical protein WC043_06580 [Pseudobdellovibrionaceae bacterium]
MVYQGIQIHQIRAARSLLDWTQDDLATRTGLSKFSIANLEGSKTAPQRSTTEKVISALELAGIEFIEDGVRLKRNTVTIIDGDNWYLRLLDDVHHSLLDQDNPELILEFADESQSPIEVVEKVKAMRADGIKMRLMICEADTHIMGPLTEYRYIPKNKFRNYVTLIYADKLAVTTENQTRALVIKDELLAETRRNMYNILWDLLKQPERTTSEVRYV